MAMQYKPTKQKKEKPTKAPKAPKADKPMKMGGAVKVKAPKPAKATKAPKAPKPEKAQSFAPTFKGGKVAKAADLEKKSVLKKSVNPVVAVIIIVALIVAVLVAVLVIVPAIQKHGQEIKSIEITRVPEKTTYLVGEEADFRGLRVTVTRNNGETFVVRSTECEITGFDNTRALEKCVVKVTYQGVFAFFSVEIKENVKPAPILKSIRLDPMPKTEYKKGEWLETSGSYIVREYLDGTESRINLMNTDVWGWDKVKGPGKYTLTVKYAENGVLCTYDYEITVTAE